MKFSSKLVHATILAAMVGLMSLQSGCDSAFGSQIANAILPVNADDVTASVNQKIWDGKFKEAQDEGMAFLKKHEDKSGQLHWALARASAQLSNLDLAVKYASEAFKAGAVSTVQLIAEPMLEPVRSDNRIVSLASGIDTRVAATAGERAPGADSVAADTEARK